MPVLVQPPEPNPLEVVSGVLGPDVPILLCLWSATPEADAPARATAETAADRVATSVAGALLELEDLGVLAPEAVKAEAAD